MGFIIIFANLPYNSEINTHIYSMAFIVLILEIKMGFIILLSALRRFK